MQSHVQTHLDGSFTVWRTGMDDVRIAHAAGAAIMGGMTAQDRRPASTRRGQACVLSITRLLGVMRHLADQDLPQGLRDRLSDLRDAALAPDGNGDTAVNILMGDVHASGDLGIGTKASTRERLLRADDDPVLSALMRLHGVDHICATAPGIDSFWGGLEVSASSFGPPNPYVRYHGLPDTMPPFLVRPACTGHDSCVGIRLGGDRDAAVYCNQGGYAWLGIARELPETVIDHLEGRPATDLVGHPALEGHVIGHVQRLDGDGVPNCFPIEWRP